MSEKTTLKIHISADKSGQYLLIPFEMPADCQEFRLAYRYPRRTWEQDGDFNLRRKLNTVDLGLISPQGDQVGASGSDKSEISITETLATPGYRPWRLEAGTWQILVGAYHIAPQGVDVEYDLEFIPKQRRLLRGEMHAHTLASDGVHSLDELAAKARRAGLDFLMITDHNQMISALELPQFADLTVIPGMEWTHYRGHANFLGVDQPYEGSFACNSLEEARERFVSARDRGALITINHPFDRECGFSWDFNQLPYDCLEIWNGPMREENLWALALWQSLLSQGRKIAAVGGSDYHRDSPFLFLGGPTQCVWADSRAPSDILSALRQGRGYTIFSPEGPHLELRCAAAWPGESLPFTPGLELSLRLEGLEQSDLIRLVSASGARDLAEAPGKGNYQAQIPVEQPGFYRVEVQRSFIPGVPRLPALLSNPIYLDAP